MLSTGFELAIPEFNSPQSYALNRKDTWIDRKYNKAKKIHPKERQIVQCFINYYWCYKIKKV
jgi:formate-dependent nitrite reductase cytochrome c552 subunit